MLVTYSVDRDRISLNQSVPSGVNSTMYLVPCKLSLWISLLSFRRFRTRALFGRF